MRRLAVLLLTLVLLSPTPAFAADSPQATLFSPTAEASVAPNEPLLVIGGAYNGETGGITEVEISTDDGATWKSVDASSENWTFVFTPDTPGPLTIKARAHTASTVGPITVSRTIHVGGTTPPPVPHETFLSLHHIPKPVVQDTDDQAVELGVRTTVDRPGSLVGMHIRRGDHTGPVTARVWSSTGVLLAVQQAPGAQYWQRIDFGTPVPVAPGNEYVVSYYTPSGGYASTENYFMGRLAQPPFHTPVNAGVYRYGGGFPTDTWNASNYWVEPIFQS